MYKNIAIKKIVFVGFALACPMVVGPMLRAAEVSVADLIDGLKSSNEMARLKTIDELGSRGEVATDAVAPLTALLQDKSAAVRAHAVSSLGTIGGPAKAAVPAIAELLKDPDATVRRQIVKAIQAIHPGPEVTVPLCVKLLEESDPTIRARVLNAIADAGVKAVPGLIAALKNEQATYWALIVLREIGPEAKEAVPALIEALKDSRPEIRREAVLTLGAMNEAAEAAIPAIAALLKDDHARTAATFVLGQLGKIPADAEAACKANAKDKDMLLATVSLWALARVHPDDKELRREATEQLIARLKEKDPFVRVAAARALAALPPAPEVTAPIWEKALQDADAETVHHALDALASLGAPAVPRLIDGLKHKKMRANIASILGRIGPAAAPATNALAALVNDKDSHVAQEAAFALAAIGPAAKDAVPELIKALESGKDNDSNAIEIACCLGKIGPAAATAESVLVKQLQGSDADLALMSAWSLAQISPASAGIAGNAVPVLVKALSLSAPQSKQLAAGALGSFGPLAKDAVPALEKTAVDEDASVREVATKALAAVRQAASKTTETPVPSADLVKPAAEMPKPAVEPPKVATEKPQTFVVGDNVVTAEDKLEVGLRGAQGVELPKGSKLKIIEVRGSWLGVQAMVDGKAVTGWVLPNQVSKN